MLKIISLIFGIILLIIGILGFIPHAVVDQKLISVFAINSFLNLIHIFTGIIAIIISFTTNFTVRIFFQVFGIIYAAVAILGFIYRHEPIFGLIANNIADAWLHVVIAIFALITGFATKPVEDLSYRKTDKHTKKNDPSDDQL